MSSESWIDSEFEKLGIPSGQDFIDPESVNRDPVKLQGIAKSLKKHTDKKVSHIYRHELSTSIPAFGDLDDAIDVVADVCRKYSMLLRAGEILSFEPIVPPT